MKENISPFMRFLMIVVIIATPLAVVVLQRLDAIREIIRIHKNGEPIFNFRDIFESERRVQDEPVQIVYCLHCGAANPRGQAYCGSCGNRLNASPKE
jgi:ribosomal protein L40E